MAFKKETIQKRGRYEYLNQINRLRSVLITDNLKLLTKRIITHLIIITKLKMALLLVGKRLRAAGSKV